MTAPVPTGELAYPTTTNPHTIGDICAGYGGLALALAAAIGAEPIWHAEIDPNMSAVLEQRFEGVPNIGDFTDVNWAVVPRPSIIAAGFPCQPISSAGKQRHREDERYLWPAVYRAVRELEPGTVFLENVQNIVSVDKGSVLAEILGDLREAGYAARWATIGACSVGMAHHRHRWFLRAHRVDNCDGDIPEAERIQVKCGAPIRRTTKAGKQANAAGGKYGDKYANAGKLLPTPVARDGDHRGEGDTAYWEKRRNAGRANGVPLGAAVKLMPTPRARDYKGADNRDDRLARNTGAHAGDDLATAVTKLPEPEPGLKVFPTPRASDCDKGSPNQHGSRGDLTLPSAVHRLLPTPNATDAQGGVRDVPAERTHGGKDHGPRLRDVAPTLLPTPTASDYYGAGGGANKQGGESLRTTVSRLLPTPRATDTGTPGRRGGEGFRPPLSQVVLDKYEVRFAEYAPAIARQVTVTGVEPPEPTEPNRNGEPRLSPAFAEWLMGIPRGWVTAILTRVPALRGIGNGVVPRQAETAWHLLAPVDPDADGEDDGPAELVLFS